MKIRCHSFLALVFALIFLHGCGRDPGFDPKTGFDVPALVGLDFKGVAAKLGAPATPLVPDLSKPGLQSAARAGLLTDWGVTWQRGKTSLLVTYDIKTLRVIDFFIPTDDPSGATTNTTRLRVMGNLVETPTRYSLIPVAAGNTGKFTGLKIVPR